MKKLSILFFTIFLFTVSNAQTDTSMDKTATAVCDCLEKAGLTDKSTQSEIQNAFMNCVMASAPELMTQIMASGEDYTTAGQEIGTKLVMALMKNNCTAFTKIASAMAANGGGFEMTLPGNNSGISQEKTETVDGVIINVEERDFTYVTLKTTEGRELVFMYYKYVPGSDNWIKDPLKLLKNKNVSLSYTESEVYQPKYKQFMYIKEIKTLTIK
ncbi:MAG: hypothetical protein JST21_17605 [Bacteroidetes bacterium]|nr:hypothetical protein [Bacteroidota bacterium]